LTRIKFVTDFKDVIRKRERKPKDKWYLDGTEGWQSQMTLKINGEYLYCGELLILMVMS
jgi:hypothetical protein